MLLGQYNTLTVLRKTSVGLYLGDDEGNDVLLPNKYILPEYEIGKKIEVFVYKDYEQRWVATNLKPEVCLHEFAYLRVRSSNDIGAFLIWGLEKDLFVPFREQRHKMIAGQSYVVYVTTDEQTQRLIASSKLNKYLSNGELTVDVGQEVELLVFETTPMGYNVIVNQKHKGLIYHDEVFKPVHVGDHLKGFVKTIREDNSIDISLQAKGMVRLEAGAEFILNYLQSHKGFLSLTDKSSADDIALHLQMSKKTFKRSVGILYKQRLISLEEKGIRLKG